MCDWTAAVLISQPGQHLSSLQKVLQNQKDVVAASVIPAAPDKRRCVRSLVLKEDFSKGHRRLRTTTDLPVASCDQDSPHSEAFR